MKRVRWARPAILACILAVTSAVAVVAQKSSSAGASNPAWFGAGNVWPSRLPIRQARPFSVATPCPISW